MLSFYGGSFSTNLPAFTRAIYRIDVPSEATIWRSAGTHAVGVQFFLEQGTLPNRAATDPWRSTTANSQLTTNLNKWPWVPGKPFYLLVTNTTSTAQSVLFAMGIDGDNDGLPDSWEFQNFGNVTSQNGSGDFDQDNVSNLDEYIEGTSPTDAAAYMARLTTTAVNGSIGRSPNASKYTLGTSVRLTPIAVAGFLFAGWTGDASGTNNPLTIIMESHRSVGAIFKRPGDDLSIALTLSGISVLGNNSTASMTKEPGEPDHAGNPGGKSIWWKWMATTSEPYIATTEGSAINTLLGVYTGTAVSNLIAVASNDNHGTNLFSRVEFTSVAGTTYLFAVDGTNGVGGSVRLRISPFDSDRDGMPDPFEIQNFGNLNQTASGDFDGDGVSNLAEFQEGTSPSDDGSFKPRLTVIAANGSVLKSPDQTNFVLNSTVNLTATANAGFVFAGWTGQASGTVNPLSVIMNTNKVITANFKLVGDDFSTAKTVLLGQIVSATNGLATKEIGEPNHAGNPGGKSMWWKWTATVGQNFIVTTEGSSFDTLLGVYTGSSVSSLNLVSSNNNSGASNFSKLQFSATAGTVYYLAVDGTNGASGTINLHVMAAASTPVMITNSTFNLSGKFGFSFSGSPGQTYDIDASADLINWLTITNIPGGSGPIQFVDPSPGSPRRFYRLRQH
jgi:uncharacterized repeat protein (TIGR02543 family)